MPKLVCGLTLLLTYGRFFAEFLGDLSLVRLGLLALNTCVGLRYGLQNTNLEVFLGSVLTQILFDESPILPAALAYMADLPTMHNHSMNPNPIRGLRYNPPSLHRITL